MQQGFLYVICQSYRERRGSQARCLRSFNFNLNRHLSGGERHGSRRLRAEGARDVWSISAQFRVGLRWHIHECRDTSLLSGSRERAHGILCRVRVRLDTFLQRRYISLHCPRLRKDALVQSGRDSSLLLTSCRSFFPRRELNGVRIYFHSIREWEAVPYFSSIETKKPVVGTTGKSSVFSLISPSLDATPNEDNDRDNNDPPKRVSNHKRRHINIEPLMQPVHDE